MSYVPYSHTYDGHNTYPDIESSVVRRSVSHFCFSTSKNFKSTFSTENRILSSLTQKNQLQNIFQTLKNVTLMCFLTILIKNLYSSLSLSLSFSGSRSQWKSHTNLSKPFPHCHQMYDAELKKFICKSDFLVEFLLLFREPSWSLPTISLLIYLSIYRLKEQLEWCSYSIKRLYWEDSSFVCGIFFCRDIQRAREKRKTQT